MEVDDLRGLRGGLSDTGFEFIEGLLRGGELFEKRFDRVWR